MLQVKNYLNDLQWDGRDWIRFLVTTFLGGTDADVEALKEWMANSVARVHGPASNFMLVLSGPVAVGKTTLAEWLCPMPEYFVQRPLWALERELWVLERECFMLATSRWIWEVVELEAEPKSHLKRFIDTEEANFRRPYHTEPETHPVTASFLGTTSASGKSLPDNTRIINIREIDWNYSSFVDPADLWAQAVAIYRGES